MVSTDKLLCCLWKHRNQTLHQQQQTWWLLAGVKNAKQRKLLQLSIIKIIWTVKLRSLGTIFPQQENVFYFCEGCECEIVIWSPKAMFVPRLEIGKMLRSLISPAAVSGDLTCVCVILECLLMAILLLSVAWVGVSPAQCLSQIDPIFPFSSDMIIILSNF